MTETHFLRYTDLPSVIHVLSNRQLTLLSPDTWDDKNDSTFISLYKEKKQLKSVLALCFTQASQTYHHWRVFAPASAGICLHFSGQALRDAVNKCTGVSLGTVEYLTINEFRARSISVDDLPFLKRSQFKPEQEARLLWESATDDRTSLSLPIKVAAISRITLSPWLHPSLADGVKKLLKTVSGSTRSQSIALRSSAMLIGFDMAAAQDNVED